MPAKRRNKSTPKAVSPEVGTRRSGRSAAAAASDAINVGTKRKASPVVAVSKSATVKKGRTQSPSPSPSRQSSRGRKVGGEPEVPTKKSGRVTRNVVQEVEKNEPARGRSSSRSAKAPSTPAKSPARASPRQRSTTPSKKATQKPLASPKQKATKQTKSSPKQKPPPKAKPSPPPVSSRSRRRRGEPAEEESEEPLADEASGDKAVEPAVDDKVTEEAATNDASEDMDIAPEEDKQDVAPATDGEASEDVAAETEDDNVEQDQAEQDTEEAEAERTEQTGDSGEVQEQPASPVPVEVSADVALEQPGEEAAESEQVESDEKECESAESERVEFIENAEPVVRQVEEISSQSVAADAGKSDSVIDIADENADGVEVISDTEADVIDLNDDSVEADAPEADVINLDEESSEAPTGARGKGVEADHVEEISDDDVEEIGINGQALVIHGDTPASNGDHANSDSSSKRKIDAVDDSEVTETKKVKITEQSCANGGFVEDVSKDFVVIDMKDVPKSDSTEVLNSLPTATNNVAQQIDFSVNPVFNRAFIPNPAFVPSDTSKQFSLVTYNMLADCHLLRSDYSFTAPQYLKPEYRLPKVIEEVTYLDGDVLCMQEVDPDYYTNQLLPAMKELGYAGIHMKRTQDYYHEGEATFYKTARFTLVDQSLNSLSDLISTQFTEGIDPAIRASVMSYMDLSDVVIVTKFRCNNTGQEVTVGNVHIMWGRFEKTDAQCVQITTAVKEVYRIASAVREIVSKAGSDNFPHIVCGDFNSPPLSPGYLVACDGYPSGDETINKLMELDNLELADGKRSSLVNAVWPAFQHTSSSLRSAYKEAVGCEPEVTSSSKTSTYTLDYIFYSSNSLNNVGVLQSAPKARVLETGGIPNCYFPSDHLAMKAVLAFK